MALRVCKSYTRASERSGRLSLKSIFLPSPVDDDRIKPVEMKKTHPEYSPELPVIHAMLVPGRRYIVVLQAGYLAMWDALDPPRPKVCLKRGVPNSTTKISDLSVEGTDVVQILLRITPDW